MLEKLLLRAVIQHKAVVLLLLLLLLLLHPRLDSKDPEG